MARFFSLFLSLLFFYGCTAATIRSQNIEKSTFAIQIGAFNNVKNAELLTEKLQSKGIDAFYFKKDDGLFAVRFGTFKNRDEAEVVAKRLLQRGIISDYYIAPPTNYRRYIYKKDDKKRDDDLGVIIAKTALRFVGIPYRWGGNNVVEGMDCSGFTKAVYNLCGINIPRTAKEQYSSGDKVNMNNLLEGDLVFFGQTPKNITHVGIYVGDNYFVHAPKRGDVIKKSSLNESYFAKHYIGACRYY